MAEKDKTVWSAADNGDLAAVQSFMAAGIDVNARAQGVEILLDHGGKTMFDCLQR